MKKKLLFFMSLFWSPLSFGQNVTSFTAAGNTSCIDATGTVASYNGLQNADIDASGNLYLQILAFLNFERSVLEL